MTDDMVSRLIGEGMDPDEAEAAAARDQAWRDHDLWPSTKYMSDHLMTGIWPSRAGEGTHALDTDD